MSRRLSRLFDPGSARCGPLVRDNLAIALAQSDALRAERDRTNALLHRLIDTQEEERKQTASDLHDRMGARLFGADHGLEESLRMAGRDSRLQRRSRT